VGSGSSLLSCGVCLPPPLSQAFPLLVAGCSRPLQPGPACLFTVRGEIPPPPFGVQGAPPSLLHVFILIAYYSVSLFFPGWGSVCPGGYAALAQRCLWEHHGTAELTLWSASSQSVWECASGGCLGALLVAPFNVKWTCSVQAGGVERTKFCLFSVVLSVSCISSVSPRFYF
jgi:hypothetical protein